MDKETASLLSQSCIYFGFYIEEKTILSGLFVQISLMFV